MLPPSPTAPPTSHRRARRDGFNAPQQSDPVSEQKRAVAAVDAMQKARPLKPPSAARRP
jgi:hypothetical protein